MIWLETYLYINNDLNEIFPPFYYNLFSIFSAILHVIIMISMNNQFMKIIIATLPYTPPHIPLQI